MNRHSAGRDSKIIFFIGSSKQRNDFNQLWLHIANPGYRRPTNPMFELKNPTELKKDPLQRLLHNSTDPPQK